MSNNWPPPRLRLGFDSLTLGPGTGIEVPAHCTTVLLAADGGLRLDTPGGQSYFDQLGAACLRRGGRATASGNAHVLRWTLEAAHADAEPSSCASDRLDVLTHSVLAQPVLLRLDLIRFPAGAVAFWHTHAGPGIRCLLSGRVEVRFEGSCSEHGPLQPWYEPGDDPVRVAALGPDPALIARLLLLPRELAGGVPSIRYTRRDEEHLPRLQTYTNLLEDAQIDAYALPAGKEHQ
jgi:hypothetical protein